MVKENKDLYQCEECGFDYTERERERERVGRKMRSLV